MLSRIIPLPITVFGQLRFENQWNIPSFDVIKSFYNGILLLLSSIFVYRHCMLSINTAHSYSAIFCRWNAHAHTITRLECVTNNNQEIKYVESRIAGIRAEYRWFLFSLSFIRVFLMNFFFPRAIFCGKTWGRFFFKSAILSTLIIYFQLEKNTFCTYWYNYRWDSK